MKICGIDSLLHIFPEIIESGDIAGMSYQRWQSRLDFPVVFRLLAGWLMLLPQHLVQCLFAWAGMFDRGYQFYE